MPLIEEDLLTGAALESVALPRPPRPPRPPWIRRSLAVQLRLSLAAGLICTGIWFVSGGGHDRWPVWVWTSLATLGLAHLGILVIVRRTRGRGRLLALHLLLAALTVGYLSAAWLLAGDIGQGGRFWPRWVLFGFFLSLTVHASAARPGRRRGATDVERALVSRVDELTRTRRGALDVQTVELRRIERDLHDGAQARLVALSLTLGRAEERLRDHPEAAALVTSAHRDADLAIAELRELARGIAPPILADRGIVEAVRALGRRSGIRVAVRADVARRPPPSVELAAYFITAEALTNAVKHAGTVQSPATATVTVDLVGSTLVVQVADDGPGGADPLGAGLAGLAQRVAALDGTFTVGDLGAMTAGGSAGGSVGGTVVRAELPCGW